MSVYQTGKEVKKVFFMSLCILCIFGLGIIGNVVCSVPKVRKALEKLLDM